MLITYCQFFVEQLSMTGDYAYITVITLHSCVRRKAAQTKLYFSFNLNQVYRVSTVKLSQRHCEITTWHRKMKQQISPLIISLWKITQNDTKKYRVCPKPRAMGSNFKISKTNLGSVVFMRTFTLEAVRFVAL